MGKGKTIDSFFNKRRVECDENELVVPGSEEHNVHVQPAPPLLLEFEQQSHEEQTHQTQTNDVIFRGIESLERDPALRPQIFEFILVLCLMQEILEITEALGQALQNKSQDIVNAMRLVISTKALLAEMRSDDGWEDFFFRVLEFCENHSINIPDLEETYILRGGRARRQPDCFTKEHYFRVEVFRATLDTQLHELEFRFNEKVMDLLSTSATLIPANKFRSFKVDDICEMVKKYYPADFTQQEIYGLEQQLKHFVVDASNDKELESVSTLTKLCRFLVETGRHSIYNLIDRLLRLLVTLPVSTASAERAFSALKIVKTRLRNKMEDDFLANSLLVNIEREIAEKYSYDDVLEHFTGAKRRRAEL